MTHTEVMTWETQNKFAWILSWNGLVSILLLTTKKNSFGRKSLTITISGMSCLRLSIPVLFQFQKWYSPSIFKRIFDSVCEHNRQSNYRLQLNLYHGEIFRCWTQTRIHCRTFRARSKMVNQLNKNFWAQPGYFTFKSSFLSKRKESKTGMK